jgi:signal recognition particle subunit SRP54
MLKPGKLWCDFNLDYFRNQLKRLRGQAGPDPAELAETGLSLEHVERMLDCMTPEERQHPEIIDLDRQLRIAMLSGVKAREVQEFLWQFHDFRRACQKLGTLSAEQRRLIMSHPDKLKELLD